ncbi:MAG TPA: universal stress protein [Candidatus Limnocylindria bacterium]|jgi:nucleotide-binding universal stress UspA family protein|nr:universal stress protein [Candidatus Limnocylindria bacterium]
MNTFSRLLVATDGSGAADAAVETAVRLSVGRHDTTIRFVTAFERARLMAEYASAMTFAGSEAFDALRDSAHAALHAALARSSAAQVDAEGTVREGDPVAEILAEAVEWNATCVVMGTHGRTGVARALLGSITEETLRASALPVLVVRANHPRRTPEKAGHILCAIDDSLPARAAYDTALAIARDRDVELELLRVIPIDADVAEAYEREGRDAGGVAQFYRQYESPLAALAEQARAGGVRASARVIGAPDVGTAIVQYAAHCGADLIAMGTHARVGLSRALLGSTSEYVLRHSDVPVLITAGGDKNVSGHRESASATSGA